VPPQALHVEDVGPAFDSVERHREVGGGLLRDAADEVVVEGPGRSGTRG
jgi:hypothetical protein